MLDFCFLSTYLAHFGTNEILISPTGTDPDRPNPQTFCFNSTMRPTAESRNILISLILKLEYFYVVTDFLFRPIRVAKPYAKRYPLGQRGRCAFSHYNPCIRFSRYRNTSLSTEVPDLTSRDSRLATDLPLTHIRWAVLTMFIIQYIKLLFYEDLRYKVLSCCRLLVGRNSSPANPSGLVGSSLPTFQIG